MIPAAIFLFLTGAVLAWRFRVWILVPLGLTTVLGTLLLQLWLDFGALDACGNGFLLSATLQLGYCFGLVARSALPMRLKQRSPQRAFVAALYEQRSINKPR